MKKAILIVLFVFSTICVSQEHKHDFRDLVPEGYTIQKDLTRWDAFIVKAIKVAEALSGNDSTQFRLKQLATQNAGFGFDVHMVLQTMDLKHYSFTARIGQFGEFATTKLKPLGKKNKLLYYNPELTYLDYATVRFKPEVKKVNAVKILATIGAQSHKEFGDGFLNCYPVAFGPAVNQPEKRTSKQEQLNILNKLAKLPQVMYVVPHLNHTVDNSWDGQDVRGSILVKFKSLSVRLKKNLNTIDRLCKKINSVPIESDESFKEPFITVAFDPIKTTPKQVVDYFKSLKQHVKVAGPIGLSNAVTKKKK